MTSHRPMKMMMQPRRLEITRALHAPVQYYSRLSWSRVRRRQWQCLAAAAGVVANMTSGRRKQFFPSRLFTLTGVTGVARR